jgi:uncharacterized membrane protein
MMSINLTTATAIFGMVIVTYATRIVGLWLMKRFTFSQPIKKWLNHIPGAIMISIVAPTVINGGIADFVAALTTLFAIARTGNLFLAMFTGVGTVWILRNYLHV